MAASTPHPVLFLRYSFFMKTDRLVIFSVVLLAAGLAWLFGNTHGTMSFNAALPPSGSTFVFNLNNQGASALFGVLITIVGLISLVIAFILAIFNVLGPRRTA
jgi:hypothetical protein